MAGRRTLVTKATPRHIKFSDTKGYELIVKITEGPAHMLDRRVVVQLTGEQLDAIADWEPTGEFSRLDLENQK